MKVPDEKTQPYTYGRWEEMDILEATDTERILMLELSSIASFRSWMFGDNEWWGVEDMREFVREISKKIDDA